MPYKDKHKDRLWHRNHMRTKRKLLKSVPKSDIVTPSTSTMLDPVNHDADGYIIYDD